MLSRENSNSNLEKIFELNKTLFFLVFVCYLILLLANFLFPRLRLFNPDFLLLFLVFFGIILVVRVEHTNKHTTSKNNKKSSTSLPYFLSLVSIIIVVLYTNKNLGSLSYNLGIISGMLVLLLILLQQNKFSAQLK
ncbi:MAG TPA: hypothetical protein VJB89_00320 [Candidatus Nanoarchaeia archaeon]|nr:hypothetical protein [Candidatus Nanoarchaeia archaeon]